MASSSIEQEQVFIGPGLSLFKRVVTILGLIGVVALVLWIAVYQHSHNGASVIGSTIAAILFVAGFAYYLWIVAPVPFTIIISPQSLTKRNRNGEVIEVRWEDMIRVKEEFFRSGKRVGLTVYRKVSEPAQKPKAWAVYRDDVQDIDALAAALHAAIPPTCSWDSETVHE